MIEISEEYAEAEVYRDFVTKSHMHMYLVKVNFVDVGLSINSITVQPSTQHKGLWVQPPRYQVGGKWHRVVEHATDSILWSFIEKLALQAVKDYSAGKDEVYEPTEEEMEKPISLDDIPF